MDADFGHAIFAEGVSFKYCKFFARFVFFDAQFLDDLGGLGFGEAMVHSLTTATLQNVDYRKPITKKGETAIILEKIFAPLQAALLALALRRKFMR